MDLLAGEDGHNERYVCRHSEGTRYAIQPPASAADHSLRPREVSGRTGPADTFQRP